MACTLACVGGSDTVRPSGMAAKKRVRMPSKASAMAWNWPRISPEDSGELSAAGWDRVSVWTYAIFGLFSVAPVLRPPARRHKPRNGHCLPRLNEEDEP